MYTTNAVQTHNRCRYTRRRVRLRTDILNTDVRRRIVESSKNQLFSSHSACSRVSASKPFELTRASHVRHIRLRFLAFATLRFADTARDSFAAAPVRRPRNRYGRRKPRGETSEPTAARTPGADVVARSSSRRRRRQPCAPRDDNNNFSILGGNVTYR